MRILVLCLAVATCGEASAPITGTPEAANDAAIKQAGERECAELTNYSPDTLNTMSAEMQALVTREYKSCVDAVTRGDAPNQRGRN